MLYDPNWKPAEVEIKLEPWQNMLLDAAKVIEERGWCQGTFENSKGEVCSLGAMRIAHHGFIYANRNEREFRKNNYSEQDFRNAHDALSKVIGNCNIGVWNDCFPHTKEDVAAKLREAANVL